MLSPKRMGTNAKASVTVETTAILDSIRRIVSVLRVGSRAAEKQVGLSGAQLFVLSTLADAPALSINELADRTHTHQSSVSVVVSRLVEQGLVSRVRSGGDARRLELSLTPAARARLRKAPDTPQQRLVEAAQLLPPAQRRQLARLLARLADGMGTGEEAVEMFFEDTAPRRKAAGAQPARKRRAPRHGRA